MHANKYPQQFGWLRASGEKAKAFAHTPAAVAVLPQLKCGCMLNTYCGTRHTLLNGVRSALLPFAPVTSRCLHLLRKTGISAFDTELLRLIRLLRIVNNELSRVHTAHTMCFAKQSH